MTPWTDPPAVATAERPETESTEATFIFPQCVTGTHGMCPDHTKTSLCSCECHAAIVDLGEIADALAQTTTAFDGETGAPIVTDVDGKPAVIEPRPPQPELIAVTTEELIHTLVVQDRKIATVDDELEGVKKRKKALVERREEIIAELKSRDVTAVQMTLVEPDEVAD